MQAEPPTPPLRVVGAELRDAEGRQVTLRGANISGQHKWEPYFDYHTPDDYKLAHDAWGMNVARFLVVWSAIEPTKGTYDETYLDGVVQRVKWLHDAGFFVVVDMHQDLYGVGFRRVGGDGAPAWTCAQENYDSLVPQPMWFLNSITPQVKACFDGFWNGRELQASYAAAWGHLAERLKDEPGFTGFDPMNEPFWGSFDLGLFEQKRLVPMYALVTDAVRAHAPNAIAVYEPSAQRNLGLETHLTMPRPNAVYSPHSYDSDAESGRGFDVARRDKLLMNVSGLSAEAKALGVPLVVGEYGGISRDPGLSPYMNAQFDAFGAAGASAMLWHYGRDDGYGLLLPDGGEKTELMDAVVRPYPERIAGTLNQFSYDALTRTLTVEWLADPKVTAPSIIRVPTRGRMKTPEAHCEPTCSVTVEALTVSVKTSGSGTHKLTLTW